MDQLSVYRLDAAAGTLKPNYPPGARLALRSGPRHLDFHPNKPWVYLHQRTRLDGHHLRVGRRARRAPRNPDRLDAAGGLHGRTPPAPTSTSRHPGDFYGSNRGPRQHRRLRHRRGDRHADPDRPYLHRRAHPAQLRHRSDRHLPLRRQPGHRHDRHLPPRRRNRPPHPDRAGDERRLAGLPQDRPGRGVEGNGVSEHRAHRAAQSAQSRDGRDGRDAEGRERAEREREEQETTREERLISADSPHRLLFPIFDPSLRVSSLSLRLCVQIVLSVPALCALC